MATLTKQKLFLRLGQHSTPTTRTGTPSTWHFLPVALGGLALGGTVASEEVELERKNPGLTHLIFTTRNAAAGKIETVIYPELAGSLFDLLLSDAGNGLPPYFTIEQYWDVTLGPSWDAGDDTGRSLAGCLASGFSLQFDRSQLGTLRLSLDAYVNKDSALETAAPVPTWPTQEPMIGKRALADVDLANNSNTLAGWTGDNASLKSLQITVDNGLQLDFFRGHPSDTDLDGSWTQAFAGARKVTVSFSLLTDSAKYLDLHRLSAGLRKCAFRIAAFGSNPSGATTCAASLTAGTAVSVTVASSTGFTADDYVILWQYTAAKFAVAKVSSVTDGTHIVIDTLDVTMNGVSETIYVYNTALELKISEARIKSATPPTADGAYYRVDVVADAIVSPTLTAPITYKAYDDDNT